VTVTVGQDIYSHCHGGSRQVLSLSQRVKVGVVNVTMGQGGICHYHGGRSKQVCHCHGESRQILPRGFFVTVTMGKVGLYHQHEMSGQLLSLSRRVSSGFITDTVGQGRFPLSR
jgi:hypothetical protein